MNKSYRELRLLGTFEERLEYLRLIGNVGQETFGFDRYFNQRFYQSREWKQVRNKVLLRDNCCDLGMEGYELYGKMLIHHINPISLQDIQDASDYLFNPDNLITVSPDTHNAIHYGRELVKREPMIRTPNDTCPWKH